MSTPKPLLSLEQLQANLRRLAARLEYADEDGDLDTFDPDTFYCVLYDLANGYSGDDIADGMGLPDVSGE